MDIRCFVALELPSEIKSRAGAFMRELASLSKGVKWVLEENLHLTLKFLGNTPEAKLPAIKEALTEAVRGHCMFRVSVRGTGVFPSQRRPRVVWLGMEAGTALISLQAAVEAAMSSIGYAPEERAFTAHLTLGRVNHDKFRRGPGPDLSALINKLDESRGADFGEFDVTGITLMKSELKPSGAVYTRLFEARLFR